MENELSIDLRVKLVEHEGKKFPTCTANVSGKWFKVKFKMECNTTPKQGGMYHLVISKDDISIQKGKQYTRKDGTTGIENPTIWVSNVISLKPYTDEEMKEINRANVDSFFTINEDSIPF